MIDQTSFEIQQRDSVCKSRSNRDSYLVQKELRRYREENGNEQHIKLLEVENKMYLNFYYSGEPNYKEPRFSHIELDENSQHPQRSKTRNPDIEWGRDAVYFIRAINGLDTAPMRSYHLPPYNT